MSVAEACGKPEPVQAVPHEEWLLRLNFSPEHIDNGEVVAAAISLSDLRSRGYSVDRERLVAVAVISERAKALAENRPEVRQSPFISRFECGPVCREVDDEGNAAFHIEASPVQATDTYSANPAHAHIKSAMRRGDGALRRLRVLLLPYLQRFIVLDEYVQNASNDDGDTARLSSQV